MGEEPEASVAFPALVATAACEPWAFALETPLDGVSLLPKEAKRRGVRVDASVLRGLWRLGLVAPLIEIRRAPLGQPHRSPLPGEPRHAAPWTQIVRAARDSGRIVDPLERGLRGSLGFEASPDDVYERRRIGLLYSRWQIIELRWVQSWIDGLLNDPLLAGRRFHYFEKAEFAIARRRSALLVALEARYMPEVSRPWTNLHHATYEEWSEYRDTFDARSVLERMGWTHEDLPFAAEQMLSQAKRIDPLKKRLSALIRRASHRVLEDLEGDALVAHDLRCGAEIVMQCYEDIGAPPAPVPMRERLHASAQRITDRSQPLDRLLSRTGLSPHPQSILIVEGETEELLAPRVRDLVQLPAGTDVMRIVTARGSAADLTKLVAAVAAPIIDSTHSQHFSLAMERPPTYVRVVMDPEHGFAPGRIDRTVHGMVDEIERVISAQGHEADRSDLEDLVSARAWSESCFEFAHFTDLELARAVVKQCPVKQVDEVRRALSLARLHRQDIGQVWKGKKWSFKPSKTQLAEELWPLLKVKILAGAADPRLPFPEMAQQMIEAFDLGSHRSAAAYHLTSVVDLGPPKWA